jgi:TorA maturation chaperone TorD
MSAQPNTATQFSAVLLARAMLYRLAARCLVDPLHAPFAQAEDVEAAEAAAQYLGEPRLARAAARVGLALPVKTAEIRDGYLRIFGMVASGEVAPYEVEYEEKTNVFFRTQQLADIAGFYRSFALDAMPGERSDHIAIEAEFLQYLLERKIAARRLGHGREKEALLDDAFLKFFRDHFGRWAASFARGLYSLARKRGNDRFYPAAAIFLKRLSEAEARRLKLPEPALRAPNEVDLSAAASCDEGECAIK